MPKYKTIIFVNGCFWHGHEGCKYFVVPKTNSDFWINKIHRTIERDKQQINKLTENGWNVIVVWECQLKAGMIDQTMLELINRIKSYKKTANTAHPLI